MKTNLMYYQNPYQTELKTQISASNQTPEGKWNIQLIDTIFYPEGGGQPGDKGYLEGQNGKAVLLCEKIKDDKVLHVCNLTGVFNVNDEVTCILDWDWRYKYMKIHSAGHLIHDVLMTLMPGLTPIKGGHGSKAFIEYSGTVNPTIQTQLEEKVNELIAADLVIKTWESSAQELGKLCQHIPKNLPANKPLRAIQIGDFSPMPDGGVQIKSTQEIGKVRITSVQNIGEISKITYQILNIS